jgi:hypothetical protein
MPIVNTKAENGKVLRRQRRWARRSTVWRYGDWMAGNADDGWASIAFRRTAGCGRACISDDHKVGLRVVQGDDGPSAYTDGTLACGSVWLCPVCSAKIAARRSIELSLAASRHVEQGGSLVMLTLTMRHDRAMPLQGLLDALGGAWRSVQQSARWRLLRDDLVGTVKAQEVTYGANGWHPHFHLLLFVKAGVEPLAVAGDLSSWLLGESAWAERVERRLGSRPDHHGVHVQAVNDQAAAYVAKIAKETARHDTKSTDALDVLCEAIDSGEAWGCARFSEYVASMRGRRQLVWSRGLRAELLPDVVELTDEQIAEQDQGGTLVGLVDGRRWAMLCRPRPGQPPEAVELLDAVEAGRKLPAYVEPPNR